jgi:hypothetical protein
MICSAPGSGMGTNGTTGTTSGGASSPSGTGAAKNVANAVYGGLSFVLVALISIGMLL